LAAGRGPLSNEGVSRLGDLWTSAEILIDLRSGRREQPPQPLKWRSQSEGERACHQPQRRSSGVRPKTERRRCHPGEAWSPRRDNRITRPMRGAATERLEARRAMAAPARMGRLAGKNRMSPRAVFTALRDLPTRAARDHAPKNRWITLAPGRCMSCTDFGAYCARLAHRVTGRRSAQGTDASLRAVFRRGCPSCASRVAHHVTAHLLTRTESTPRLIAVDAHLRILEARDGGATREHARPAAGAGALRECA
jgi:hypothetical protein